MWPQPLQITIDIPFEGTPSVSIGRMSDTTDVDFTAYVVMASTEGRQAQRLIPKKDPVARH